MYSLDEQRGQRRFWLQPFGLARILAHGVVESPLLRMTKPQDFLLALSQNRDSASRVSSCYGLLLRGTHDAARQIAGGLAVAVQRAAVDDDARDALRLRMQPAGAGWQIVDERAALGRSDAGFVEQHKVGGLARGNAPAVVQAEKVRRLGGDAPDGLLQSQHLFLLHPVRKQVGR